jgi:hypothetical protein
MQTYVHADKEAASVVAATAERLLGDAISG